MSEDIFTITAALLAHLDNGQVARHYDAMDRSGSGVAYDVRTAVGVVLAQRYREEVASMQDARLVDMLEVIADRRQGQGIAMAILRGALTQELVERHEQARAAQRLWLSGPEVPASQDAGPGAKICAAVRAKLAS